MENESSIAVLIDLQTVDLKAIAISHSLNLRPVIEAVVKGDKPTRPFLFFSQPKQISI